VYVSSVCVVCVSVGVPHAFREHFTAQQYLPDGLQGKIFYMPGDQGYENRLSAEIARKREAQLALFLTSESADWRSRTFSTNSAVQATTRDNIFKLCGSLRDKLVLVLNGDNGILYWEAMRSSDSQGIWLELESDTRELIKSQLGDKSHKNMGRIVLKSEASSAYADAGEPVHFDRILAQGLFKSGENQDSVLRRLTDLLTPSGYAILCEKLHVKTKKIYELLAEKKMAGVILNKIKEAELAYNQERVEQGYYFNPELLRSNPGSHNLKYDELLREKCTYEVYLSEKMILGWFDGEKKPGLKNYRTLLEPVLAEAEIEKLQQDCLAMLAGRSCTWHSNYLYFKMGR